MPRSRVKSLEGLRILGRIAPQALRAGALPVLMSPCLCHFCWVARMPCDEARMETFTHAISFLPPADAKVVAFYAKLRERQLRALGLDPAQFKTLS